MPLGIPHKKMRKQLKKATTPGREKPKCVATNEMRNASKRNRAYKEKEYQNVIDAWNKRLK